MNKLEQSLKIMEKILSTKTKEEIDKELLELNDGFHCACCNNSRGKNNTLNKIARKDLKYEIENINIKDILEEENYIKGE